jgi:hypothetical protein
MTQVILARIIQPGYFIGDNAVATILGDSKGDGKLDALAAACSPRSDVTISHTRRDKTVMAKNLLRLHLSSRLLRHAIGLITGSCQAVPVETARYCSPTGVTLGLCGRRQDARMQAVFRDGRLLVAERETAAHGRVSRRYSAVSLA